MGFGFDWRLGFGGGGWMGLGQSSHPYGVFLVLTNLLLGFAPEKRQFLEYVHAVQE